MLELCLCLSLAHIDQSEKVQRIQRLVRGEMGEKCTKVREKVRMVQRLVQRQSSPFRPLYQPFHATDTDFVSDY